MWISFCYGIMEIIDGIVRVCTLGLVATKLPMWYLTRVEINKRKRMGEDWIE